MELPLGRFVKSSPRWKLRIVMSDNTIEKWSTLKEVQEHLGVGRETILQWIAKKNMPAYKMGRLWKFKLSEVDEWVKSGEAADNNSSAED